MDDANTTGADGPGSSATAGIGVATNPEGTDVPLFPAELLASSKDELMVMGALVIKGMDLKIVAEGICS